MTIATETPIRTRVDIPWLDCAVAAKHLQDMTYEIIEKIERLCRQYRNIDHLDVEARLGSISADYRAMTLRMRLDTLAARLVEDIRYAREFDFVTQAMNDVLTIARKVLANVEEVI